MAAFAQSALKLLPTNPLDEQRKLDRLRELRAAIDSIRCEQTGQDPLLAWVLDQERSSANADMSLPR